MDFNQALQGIQESFTRQELDALDKQEVNDPEYIKKLIMKKKNLKDPKQAEKFTVDRNTGKIIPAIQGMNTILKTAETKIR